MEVYPAEEAMRRCLPKTTYWGNHQTQALKTGIEM